MPSQPIGPGHGSATGGLHLENLDRTALIDTTGEPAGIKHLPGLAVVAHFMGPDPSKPKDTLADPDITSRPGVRPCT